MDNHHSTHAEFFEKLANLLASPHSKGTGAVHLVQKRLVHSNSNDALESNSSPTFSDLSLSDPVPILVRATDGTGKSDRNRKIKVSTIVQPEELEAFFVRYAEVCRGGMQALKKRDRKTRRKKKGKPQTSGATTQK